MNSWSTFTFEPETKLPKATYYVEQITFQCPVIFSYICEKEILYQRRMIASNLQKEFSMR